MPHELAKAYNPGTIETRWAEYWVKENLFAVSGPPQQGQPVFTLLLPPPNVTGHLHIMAAGNRSCRHCHPVDGRAPAHQRGRQAARSGTREICRARLAVARALRRSDPRADEAPGRLGGLVA